MAQEGDQTTESRRSNLQLGPKPVELRHDANDELVRDCCGNSELHGHHSLWRNRDERDRVRPARHTVVVRNRGSFDSEAIAHVTARTIQVSVYATVGVVVPHPLFDGVVGFKEIRVFSLARSEFRPHFIGRKVKDLGIIPGQPSLRLVRQFYERRVDLRRHGILHRDGERGHLIWVVGGA